LKELNVRRLKAAFWKWHRWDWTKIKREGDWKIKKMGKREGGVRPPSMIHTFHLPILLPLGAEKRLGEIITGGYGPKRIKRP
jgi:hypothetical protein